MESIQHQLQEEERSHAWHQVQKRSQKIQSIRDKRKIDRKKAWRQEQKCENSERKLSGRKSVSHCCRTKSTKRNGRCGNGSRTSGGAGEERRGSNASQAVDCCMETMVEQIFAMGADQARSMFDAVCQIFFKKFEASTPLAKMPGKGGGRRNSEDEHEQGKASQQLALSASGEFSEGISASCMELVFGVHMVNAEGQGIQVQQRIEKDLCRTPKSTSGGRENTSLGTF